MKHKITQHIRKTTGTRGFALLIGVVMASVLISITFVMFSISLKQVSLSTTGKNSQYALFAADTGLECALYADYKVLKSFVDPVVTTNGSDTIVTPNKPNPPTPFICSNKSIRLGDDLQLVKESNIVVNNVTYPKGLVWTFTVKYPTTPQCAIVTITKYVVVETSGGVNTDVIRTKIESRGYNTCPTTNPTDPQRVERGLEVHY
ncbi:MAG: seg [Candidatus Paceibacter sp.]|jgi:hypothetical protein|nr:seg [Candidatus Paceibacter sp.]